MDAAEALANAASHPIATYPAAQVASSQSMTKKNLHSNYTVNNIFPLSQNITNLFRFVLIKLNNFILTNNISKNNLFQIEKVIRYDSCLFHDEYANINFMLSIFIIFFSIYSQRLKIFDLE